MRGARAVAWALPLSLFVGLSLPSGASAQTASAKEPASSCDLATSDRRWLDEAIVAWSYASERFAQRQATDLTALIFDERCVVKSDTAMTGGLALWSGQTHPKLVPLPDGGSLPPQVASFAAPAGDGAFFVMAVPSIWKARGVEAAELGIEKLMTAVLLHEGIHVLQFPTYGRRMDALTQRYRLPDDFNDDSIQTSFQSNPDFAGSIARETDLLFAAAAAPNIAIARTLAKEARTMMQSRQDRWYKGDSHYLRDAEDIWLTMEGSGQWVAYRWLTDSEGGGVPAQVALPAFGRRGNSWSQTQGLALFLALARIAPDGWLPAVFGGSSQPATQILDRVLSAAPKVQ